MTSVQTSKLTTRIVYSDTIEEQDTKEIKTFCTTAFSEKKHPNHPNMDVTRWEEKPHTLMYKLLSEKIFHSDVGGLVLLYDPKHLIGISGFYQSKFDPNCWIGGVRTWLIKKYRFTYSVVTHMLPVQFERAKERKGKAFLLTFNEEMRAFAYLIERCNNTLNAGGSYVLYFHDKFPEFYRDVVRYEKRLLIQNVYQHVLVKPIDPEYKPDFSTIEEPCSTNQTVT